jgi:hypothetical protein
MFGKVDLSSTIGLDTIRHKGRSSLDLVSLFDYHGEVPNAFLIGCGVPREFTANIQSLTFKISNFYSCFISYSHADKSFARRLHDRLQARGIRCWLDEKQVFPGDNIYAKVEEGIELWDKVLLCGSEASLTSGWVDDEIKHAFAKEKRLFSERSREVLALIPLNLDGYILDKWEHPKKNLVLERLVADFVGWKSDGTKFEQALERVVNALRTDEAAREKPPNPKL